MGLDMFAYITKEPVAAVDCKIPEVSRKIAHWRKHPDMQGWMERLYRAKGGTAESFDCMRVRIDAEDLDALERALDEHGLPETTGSSFGETRSEQIEIDRAFIAAARAALASGDFVFYFSWLW